MAKLHRADLLIPGTLRRETMSYIQINMIKCTDILPRDIHSDMEIFAIRLTG